MSEKEFKLQVKSGERFEFGKNWQSFLESLNNERISTAKESITSMIDEDNLHGKSFLDIGNGSGVFSLAARQLGAKVHSFDFDPASVNCARELKKIYFFEDKDWRIEEASVLDVKYLNSIGQFDIVYSWGVLHHTGNMWQALENISSIVKKDGKLFISLYNDQGKMSSVWKFHKKMYNKLPVPFKNLYGFLVMGVRELYSFIGNSILLKPMKYINYWRRYSSNRGMSYWHDLVDWIGGYPFEVSKPEQIFDFFYKKGFKLIRLRTSGGGLGCNEYVFVKE